MGLEFNIILKLFKERQIKMNPAVLPYSFSDKAILFRNCRKPQYLFNVSSKRFP